MLYYDSDWSIGRRVSRRDGSDAGTIVDSGNQDLKVKWDSGRTSYFQRQKLSDIVLDPDRATVRW